MAIFAKFKKAKAIAKAQEAEKGKEPAAPQAPYKHVVAHAARDCQSVPGAYDEVDRPLIKEYGRRTSQLAKSRQSSMLSTVSSMNDQATSMAGPSRPRSSRNHDFPANYTENTYYNTGWADERMNTVHLKPSASTSTLSTNNGSSYGRRRYPRGNISQDSGIGPSPLSTYTVNSADVSAAVSFHKPTKSQNSSSSKSLEISAQPESNSSAPPSEPDNVDKRSMSSRAVSVQVTPAAANLVQDMIAAKFAAMPPKRAPVEKKSRWSFMRGKKTTAESISVA